MKKLIILIGVAGIMSTGCENFLEIYPETSLSSETFFKTEADFEQAVNAAYAPLRNIVNDRAWLLSEMRSDNTYFARNPNFGATEQSEDLADFVVPEANGVTSNTHVLNQYRLDYQIIARVNQVLATIDGVEFDAESKNNLKGQAHFLRALAYFQLVSYFGTAPLHLVPTIGREDATLPLASEDELYAQIIQDAGLAVQLLPPKSEQELGRATSGAARTLLANVHIVREEWAAAETILKEVVESNEYGLMPDYNNAFSNSTSNKNNIESVFEVQFMEGPAGMNGNFMYLFMPRPISATELTTLTRTSNAQPLDGQANNIPTPDIIAAYEDGDERKDASIGYIELKDAPWEEDVYPYIKKFVRPHSLHNNHGMNWPMYRYAEVLLFLAEALNEQGKDGEAVQYLNQVRDRAGLDPATGDLREAIFNERRVELAFENKRWFDLVRTGRAIETMTAFGERVKADP